MMIIARGSVLSSLSLFLGWGLERKYTPCRGHGRTRLLVGGTGPLGGSGTNETAQLGGNESFFDG